MQFSLKQLRYATALAEHGHFGKAAAACNVTQSALSQQISAMEAQCNLPLFERENRPISLSPFGEEFLNRASAIVGQVEELEQFAQHTTGTLQRPLAIGLIPTIAPYLLPTLYPALHKALPDVEFAPKERQTDDLLALLTAGEIDAAIIATELPKGLPLEGETLFADPFVLASGNPSSLSGPISLPDVPQDSLLLLDEGHCFRDQAISACGMDTNGPPHPFSATSLSTIVEFVANGRGVTLLPAISIRKEAADGRILVHALASPGAERVLSLVWRRASPFVALYRQIAEVIRQSGEQLTVQPTRRRKA